jgi:adenine-specific DNA methylase
MTKRLIETAFPLAQTSAASLHEKNMRHGHISTLHLWPARRPLAACRAAIAAALLSDPGNDEERNAIVRRLGGELFAKPKTAKDGKTEKDSVTGKGGILWWGTETGPDLAWFRERIKTAYGERAPRVLDPFAGGGAIPLEAMRLGCEVVANDLNPVSWFILKCTLDYPQRLGSERRPLPSFVLHDHDFMTVFLKAQGMKGRRLEAAVGRAAGNDDGEPPLIDDPNRPWLRADLGWHVRAWGHWVLAETRRELAVRYPTYAEWMALRPGGDVEPRPLQLLEPDGAGLVDVKRLNADIPTAALADPRTPRWVAKPTVAYLWARTVRCKSCRATVPLLKTRWLCRKDDKRVLLTMAPNPIRDGVIFGVESGVPVEGVSAGARKAADRRMAGGTMSRNGVWCPCCGRPGTVQMTMEDIRFEGQAKRLGAVMTAVVVDGPAGKEYRRPTALELAIAEISKADLEAAYAEVPFGMPHEHLPSKEAPGIRIPLYGFTEWADLFTPRQLLTLATLTRAVRRVKAAALGAGYSDAWGEALWAYLALAIDRQADYGSAVCSWHNSKEQLRNTFGRFALPIVWDFTETNPFSGLTGDFLGALEWIGRVVSRGIVDPASRQAVTIACESAMEIQGPFDAIVTDPPYYDAIPYSDLMDFFYVWLRRVLNGMSPDVDTAFASPLGPKWNHDSGDGELIDDSSRFGGDRAASKKNFEDGMAAVFRRCNAALMPDGILVIVFANKNPEAWETLVGALIRSGFVVDGSLPIQTEMGSRTRAMNSAALSSSVWLVCRKRISTRPGYDRPVLSAMRAKIADQMRRFWDAGIRGPDFLWAATGPALEAYSQHPIVLREATVSGEKQSMPVAEFLREVRRLVVEFAVGRVLRGEGGDGVAASLDDVTTYYLLHRETFGMNEAPIGAVILYAQSCGLSDSDLVDRWELLARGKSSAQAETESDDDTEEDDADDGEQEDEVTSADDSVSGGGSTVRLRPWNARKRKALGLEGIGGKSVPMIDRLHRLMMLWKEGDVAKVDTFLSEAALARDPLFAQIAQAVIELARRDGKLDEAATLESISKHIQSRSGLAAARQPAMI